MGLQGGVGAVAEASPSPVPPQGTERCIPHGFWESCELILPAQHQKHPVSEEVVPAVPVVSWHFRGALSLSLSVFTLDRISQLRVLFLLFIRLWLWMLGWAGRRRAGMGKSRNFVLAGFVFALSALAGFARGEKKGI